MYCNYDINGIQDLGNKVFVDISFFEGDYQDETDPITNETKKVYKRTNKICVGTFTLEHSPVTNDEIKLYSKQALERIKGDRIIIPECL